MVPLDKQTGDNRLVLRIMPALSPQARARGAQNRARYPHASDGVSLPPIVPEAIELLKARMVLDLNRQYTDKQRLAIAAFVVTALAAGIGFRSGVDSTTAVVIVVIVWAAFMALLPVGLVVCRHYGANIPPSWRPPALLR